MIFTALAIIMLGTCTILLLAAAANLAQSVSTPNTRSSQQRLQKWGQLGDADGVVDLTDSLIQELVIVPHSRPYDTFIFFTGRLAKYGCKTCNAFEKELRLLAASYKNNGGEKSRTKDDLPIVFGIADYPRCSLTFARLSIDEVPVLAFLRGGLPVNFSTIPRELVYSIDPDDMSAEHMARFVVERTNISVRITRPHPNALLAWCIIASGLLVILWFSWRAALEALVWLQRQRAVWFLVCLSFYCVGISGFLFDIIRGAPLFGSNPKTHLLMLALQQSNSQSVVEGLFIAALNLACAFAVILLIRVLPGVRDKGSRTILAVSAMAGFLMFYSHIVGMYRWKNGWYMRG